ncbi:MAG: hypothetical protein ACAI34_25225 [Verrucomicrobium sp.]
MNPTPPQTTPAVTEEESNEQQMMPYDQNRAHLMGESKPEEPAASDVPTDENLVDDDVVEEGGHTT